MVGEAASGRACGTRPSVEEGRRRGHDGTPAVREREGKERRGERGRPASIATVGQRGAGRGRQWPQEEEGGGEKT
jgi:hypothetical protein